MSSKTLGKIILVCLLAIIAAIVVRATSPSQAPVDAQGDDPASYSEGFRDALHHFSHGISISSQDLNPEDVERLLKAVETPEDGKQALWEIRINAPYNLQVLYEPVATEIWHRACLEDMRNATEVNKNLLRDRCPEDRRYQYIATLMANDRTCSEYQLLYENLVCDYLAWSSDETQEELDARKAVCHPISLRRDEACLDLVAQATTCGEGIALLESLPGAYHDSLIDRLRPCLVRRVMKAQTFAEVEKIRGTFDYRWDLEASPEMSEHVLSLIKTSTDAREAQQFTGLPYQPLMARWQEVSLQEIEAAGSVEEARIAGLNAPRELERVATEKIADLIKPESE